MVAGRGRPPEAAARRAGLEEVEKVVTTGLDRALPLPKSANRPGLRPAARRRTCRPARPSACEHPVLAHACRC
jgi:hypothetical protein